MRDIRHKSRGNKLEKIENCPISIKNLYTGLKMVGEFKNNYEIHVWRFFHSEGVTHVASVTNFEIII